MGKGGGMDKSKKQTLQRSNVVKYN